MIVWKVLIGKQQQGEKKFWKQNQLRHWKQKHEVYLHEINKTALIPFDDDENT